MQPIMVYMSTESEPVYTFSFDVGTVHLAYCVFKGNKLHRWKVVNLLQPIDDTTTIVVDDELPCSHVVSNRKCKRTCKWTVNGCGWCGQHVPKESEGTENWTNAFLNKQTKASLLLLLPQVTEPHNQTKAELIAAAKHKRREAIVSAKPNVAQVFHTPTVAKNLIKEFDEQFQLLSADTSVQVLIENQMMDRMRTVQGMIVQLFACRFPAAPIHIIHACNKLKHLTDDEKKNTYDKRKDAGVQECISWLQHTGHTEYVNVINDAKKKDDLADCLLQSVCYLGLHKLSL